MVTVRFYDFNTDKAIMFFSFDGRLTAKDFKNIKLGLYEMFDMGFESFSADIYPDCDTMNVPIDWKNTGTYSIEIFPIYGYNDVYAYTINGKLTNFFSGKSIRRMFNHK